MQAFLFFPLIIDECLLIRLGVKFDGGMLRAPSLSVHSLIFACLLSVSVGSGEEG